jgi:hypothetical protein
MEFKFYDLPVDTCQSILNSKGLHIHKPGVCSDGSRARRARYWDDECKDLYYITDIKDEAFEWNGCEFLNIATWYFGSVALYCARPKSARAAIDDVAEDTNEKEISLLETTSKLQNTMLPRKSWWVPF